MVERYWWPLENSDGLEQSFEAGVADLADTPAELDGVALARADRLTVATLKSGLPRILARDTLPSLCHLFVGWGDACYEGRHLTEEVRTYVHADGPREFVHQADGEGDFHPWQTFCYLLMGGVDPDRKLTARSTLRDLARNSRTIHTTAMEDLGHLLFALSHLGLDDGLAFRFTAAAGDESLELDVYGMISHAVRAHHHGHFDVCRKFHLTEGLCAVAGRMEGLERLRPVAQGFLSGQMDLLVLLHRVLRLASRFDHLTASEAEELTALRNGLFMGPLFENHLYYIGHLVELACFGMRFGFQLTEVQRAAAIACLNECNRLIERFASGMARAEVLLPFSHYRRGLTLWPSAAVGSQEPLDAFRADFDAVDALPDAANAASSDAFSFAVDTEMPSDRFRDVLEAFAHRHPDLPEPKGSIRHFRRLIPPGWDRRLHYEFLDYGDKVGVEIHFESPGLSRFLPSIRDKVRPLVEQHRAEPGFERHFPDGKSKLALVFDGTVLPEKLADVMKDLIRTTRDDLEAEFRNA